MRYLLIGYINRALYIDYIDCLLIAYGCCGLLFGKGLEHLACGGAVLGMLKLVHLAQQLVGKHVF